LGTWCSWWDLGIVFVVLTSGFSFQLLLQCLVWRWIVCKLRLTVRGSFRQRSSWGTATDVRIIQERVVSMIIGFAFFNKGLISSLGDRSGICAGIIVRLGVREVLLLVVSFLYSRQRNIGTGFEKLFPKLARHQFRFLYTDGCIPWILPILLLNALNIVRQSVEYWKSQCDVLG